MRQSTKEAIAEAFEGLLEKRSIDKVTVKDIVAVCGKPSDLLLPLSGYL